MQRRRRLQALTTVVALIAPACSGSTAPSASPATTIDSPTVATTTPANDLHTGSSGVGIDDWLTALMPWGWRGAVAVIDDGTPVLTKGYGQRSPDAERDPIGVDTRFSIGSNTKPITALAVLMLQDQGQLDLDATVGSLLSEVPANRESITVRHLLTHTSGLEAHHGADDEPLTENEALDRIWAADVLFEPGEGSSYSNSGYTVLAAVIESVTGMSFEDVLRTTIFEPAGMTHSGFLGEPVPSGQHDASGSGPDGWLRAPSEQPPVGWALRGAGGVVSTVADLVALDRTIGSGAILSADARRRWQEPLIAGGQDGYGWLIGEVEPGLMVRTNAGGNDEIGHYSVWTNVDSVGRSIIVLSADSRIRAEQLGRPVRHLLDGDPVPDPPELRDADADELATYAGTYRSSAADTIEVVATVDGLRLSPDGLGAFADVVPASGAQVEVAGPQRVLELVENFEGPVYLQWLKERVNELGALVEIVLVGVATIDAPEPATFVRFVFERGSELTQWAFTPQGQAMSIQLRADPPSLYVRPARLGGFVTFSLADSETLDSVRFDDGIMTIAVGGRTVEYGLEG